MKRNQNKIEFTILFLMRFLISCVNSNTRNSNNLKQANPIKTPNTWTLYEIENIGEIAIPPTLEIRGDNSVHKLKIDKRREYYANYLKIDIFESDVVFQPKGMDDFDIGAIEKYARVLIHHHKGEPGDFPRLNEGSEMSVSEQKELDQYFREELKGSMSLVNTKLLEWEPLKIGEVNGASYIKLSYTRQKANNPAVKVETCKLFNDDEAVELTISYRIAESDIWEADLNRIIDTFSFKNNKETNVDKIEQVEDRSELMTVSYNGVSFKCPNNWDVQKNVEHEGMMYQISCTEETNSSANIFTVLLIKAEVSPKEIILNTIIVMKENPVYESLNFSSITTTQFNNLSSQSMDYSAKVQGENFYANITSFNTNSKTISIMKMSDSKSKLNSVFKVMEESLEIE